MISIDTVYQRVLALANKESMVMAGWIIKEIQKKNESKIIPVDSEHSAIFQCLTGESKEDIKRIINEFNFKPKKNLIKSINYLINNYKKHA